MIESKLPAVGTTIFSLMSALAAEHQAVNLSQGFPDFPIDPQLKKYVVEALDHNQVQYAPMHGRQDLREAIAKKIAEQHHITVDPNQEITITAGATQGIYTVISTLIHAGDEVILFDPAYDCYDPAIVVNKGIPIHLNLEFPSYKINWAAVNEAANERTKLIIVNNPHNPTGTVWTVDDLHELENLLKKHPQLLVLSDEVYEHIQFDGQHQSVLHNEFIRQRSFVTFSFGKSLHVTGWKVGYCIAPPKRTSEFRKIHQFLVFCVNNTMQYAIARYLETTDIHQEIHALYSKKRTLFLDKLKDSRFKLMPCEGTYFCLLDYGVISDLADVEFAKKMTIEYGVAVIPVSVFYKDLSDNKVIRICFAKEDQTLINAAKLLCKI